MIMNKEIFEHDIIPHINGLTQGCESTLNILDEDVICPLKRIKQLIAEKYQNDPPMIDNSSRQAPQEIEMSPVD